MTQNSVDNKDKVDKETNVFDVIKNISSGKDTTKSTTEKLLLEYNAVPVVKVPPIPPVVYVVVPFVFDVVKLYPVAVFIVPVYGIV